MATMATMATMAGCMASDCNVRCGDRGPLRELTEPL